MIIYLVKLSDEIFFVSFSLDNTRVSQLECGENGLGWLYLLTIKLQISQVEKNNVKRKFTSFRKGKGKGKSSPFKLLQSERQYVNENFFKSIRYLYGNIKQVIFFFYFCSSLCKSVFGKRQKMYRKKENSQCQKNT